ncbi:Xaa-Pro peptidase family protein [Mesorhizobium sp.]|uniref:M24 family metallopeptidase n=1 Tax=Mesorhizobium sp. TaxID=1871066 RepID=UPI000FEA3891|nr:Xaa-Pro peptidase family protein [Mesorhizobium sp.]RWI99672.1 MAG: M24 family metallopeptidase [Mesorhizobium sp.]RWL96348.1 MAG: M24 family metallopeptidase [Mesorhizobium sp.]RWO85897.1 MAG: M24 family metallopeptidase [Mesorhizobium sp.]
MTAFSQQEYRERTRRLRQRMAECGIDAMLVLNEGNINYLTGYEGYSDYVPQVALVSQDEEDPWLILREMDTLCATPTVYLPESRVLSYAEKYIGSSQRTPWEPIGELVRERAKSNRIGLEMTAKGFGVKDHTALANSLDLSRAIDADGMLSKLQAVKSPAELAYMEQAGKIVDRAMQVARLEVAAGARECDVGAAIASAVIKGTPDIPGGPCYGSPTMPVGSPANAPHLKWSDASYKMGCQTNFELGAYRHRYACALSRTVFLGEPTPRAQHLHKAALDGFLAEVETIRPGVKCSDVWHAFQRAFKPYGVRKESRSGYSIGLDWVDGGGSFHEDDHTVIEPNMAFHVLIGIFEKDDGYIFSETVRVTENAAVSLSNMSRDLLVNFG